MDRIRSASPHFQFINRWTNILLLTIFAIALTSHSGLASVQTSATIVLAGTGNCADVNNDSVDPGASVITWVCNQGANQNWLPKANGVGYALINQNSNQCMDINNASTAVGAGVIQWTCNYEGNQTYTFKAQGNGYAIVASHSGLCVTAASTTNQGTQMTQQKCTGSATQTWQINGLQTTPAALPSKWTAPIAMPIVPAAIANLPDGTILAWSADYVDSFSPNEVTPGKTYTSVFNPSTSKATQVLVSNTGHDMFCPGIANLPDGRIFVTGGSSSAKASYYTPSTKTWTSASNMNIARAYQGSLTLSNGNVFVIGGSWNGGWGNKTGETWTNNAGWTVNWSLIADYILTNDAGGIYRSDNHAWMFALSNGRIFHAGPSTAMHWFDTAGNGTVTDAGKRGADTDAMNGNAVMYDIGKILAVGGAPSYEQSTATSNATLIDISTGTAKTTTLKPMSYQRAFANSVVLPNGQIVVVGGQTFAQPFSDDTAILTPELWDPTTQTFSPLAPQAVPRTYHSVALLLPDGRVISGGGGLCGGCTTNHEDFEILTPPYLLNANGTAATRPTLSSAPTDATLGTTIAVAASSGVKSFALMRLSSATHALNNEQRRVPVSFTTGTGGEYKVKIPADPGTVVPGYYMLFAMNGNGVPSVSKTLRIH